NTEEGVQVLTRGPVHEAFAETVTFDPEPGIVVAKAPPAAIEEVPPEQRLEGANIAWIPGYWGWDDEGNDFLWVSGIWRDLPPGRQWVPGYWGQSGQGFQWTSGYWANTQVSDVEYLPEPPATVEAGPNIAAPLPDDTWLPGCWVWQTGRYAWRPGFWAPVQPNWVWIPAHYVWAPLGYVFVDGYWDYSIGRRGVLFAPVYFNADVYGRRGFLYSPATVINPAVFANYLFLRPQYQHYYFGDYYAANYGSEGFYPSYAINSGRFGYDPIYAYDRWQHRQDRGWEQRQRADFQDRRAHEDLRPPRTWAAQKGIDARTVQSREKGIVMAASLDHLTRSKNSPLRFQPVDKAERQRLVQQAQDVQRFRQQRQKLENNVAGDAAGTPTKEFAPAKVRLPASPIVAKPVAEIGKDHAPPKMYEAPRPDRKVEPKPRANQLGPAIPPRVDQPRPQPQPKAERPAPQPQPQPKAERPAPQPEPKAERPAPQPQPKAERPVPQPQPKAERPVPQPQPKVEQPSPPLRGNGPVGPPPAGPK
ncbi:MAG: hypothetical protein ABSG53_28335, partial [Thermoguttaceae bacterium]